MKQRWLVAVAVSLVAAALLMPQVAVAKRSEDGESRGAKVKAAKGRAASKADRGDRGNVQKSAKPDKAEGGRGPKSRRGTGAQAADETSGSVDGSGTVETSPSPAPERPRGIANALSRLQRNLARAQARFDAGLRTSLPGGLIGTIQKFMGWLGLTPSTPSSETSGTPEPTSTVEPTATVEPTSTPEATVTPQP